MDDISSGLKVCMIITALMVIMCSGAALFGLHLANEYSDRFNNAVNSGYTVILDGRTLSDSEIKTVSQNVYGYDLYYNDITRAINANKHKSSENASSGSSSGLIVIAIILMLSSIGGFSWMSR